MRTPAQPVSVLCRHDPRTSEFAASWAGREGAATQKPKSAAGVISVILRLRGLSESPSSSVLNHPPYHPHRPINGAPKPAASLAMKPTPALRAS
jgi:hypothetical protein